MDSPKRTAQRKAESTSCAILLSRLRHPGIFRNVTDNDYGVDVEIELVKGESVTGNYFKAQVKAADKVKVRKKDLVPTVGGIKLASSRSDDANAALVEVAQAARTHSLPQLRIGILPIRRRTDSRRPAWEAGFRRKAKQLMADTWRERP
jgi:hypothetical protein